MKRRYYTWQDVETAANAIMADLLQGTWRPDYIVGITRGGLPLALLLSHRLGVRMETLKVSLRNDSELGNETNCWMSEDAFGYADVVDRDGVWSKAISDPDFKKNILVVDDINDTGATFAWIKQDWQSSCLPKETDAWNGVWGGNVRFAVMTENLSSEFGLVNYYWDTVNKAEEDVWLCYPWERESWLKRSME